MPIRQHTLRFLVVYLFTAILTLSFNTVWAGAADFTSDTNTSETNNTNSSIIPTKCPALTDCFHSAEAAKQAREKYAKANNCYFLEDVCENHVKNDKDGAQAEDQGFWGGLWSDIKAGVKYGYDFTKGLFAGLKDQITDIVELITNPLEVAKGLAALAQAFYDDFQGTLKILGELLGEEVAKTIARATECGPYNLGKVIGENINPVVMLKLATKLAKYSGKLSGAVKGLKKDIGCASFIAGTLILTPQSAVPIEQIKQGDFVESRHEQTWFDKSQEVTKTFSRTAPTYRALKTEKETFYLTEEHPLWVQGKGWTEAKDVQVDDVIAAKADDSLVLENTPVKQAVQVYNFSVNKTASYFVGEAGLWVHNAKCDLIPGGSLSAHEGVGKGHTLERHVNVTTSDLADRANGRGAYAGQKPPPMSSRYKDRATAEFVIAQIIGDRKADIDAWLSDPSKSKIELDSNSTYKINIGEGVARGSEMAQSFNKAKVVLFKDSSVPEGYYILTSFPQP